MDGMSMGPALADADDEMDALRAERDRLREDYERVKRIAEAASRRHHKERRAMAAENAALRKALKKPLDHWCDQVAAWEGPGMMEDPPWVEPCAAALASPSPLASAVQRVLEAVGNEYRAPHLESHLCEECEKDEVVALTARPHDATMESYRALRALLEGKESP